ncbi:MAG: TIGR00341 family protein [Polyangiales bacterium]
MSLRGREIGAAAARDAALLALPRRFPIEEAFVDRHDDRVRATLLVRTDAVEPLLDAIEHALAGSPFRAVVSDVSATTPALAPRPQVRWRDRLRRRSRAEVRATLSEAIVLDGVTLALVALSTVVAAIGLLQDDVAVVVGAMALAPFLAPLVALALGAATFDASLALRGVATATAGSVLAFGLAWLGGYVAGHVETAQVLARTELTTGHLAVAIAGGVAGALAQTRDVGAALVGVMVAAALLPPLTAAGLLVGAGELEAATRAAALYGVNVGGVIVGAAACLVAQGFRPKRHAAALSEGLSPTLPHGE